VAAVVLFDDGVGTLSNVSPYWLAPLVFVAVLIYLLWNGIPQRIINSHKDAADAAGKDLDINKSYATDLEAKLERVDREHKAEVERLTTELQGYKGDVARLLREAQVRIDIERELSRENDTLKRGTVDRDKEILDLRRDLNEALKSGRKEGQP
jgi:predicted RNase H-like nuclease (RuvC/YqgF family)